MIFQTPLWRIAPLLALAAMAGCSQLHAPALPAAITATEPAPLPPALMTRLAHTTSNKEFVVYHPAPDTNLWARVRRGFVMADMQAPRVNAQELWYASRPDYIKRFVERGSRYLYHIVEEVERRGLPTEIVLLPIIESAFNPQAYSRAHASGMWQFIPSTGKNFGLKQDWMTDNRRDVLLSTHAALDYLTKLHGMFNSWELAFAAYNCGEGCVGRAIAKNQRLGLPTDFASLKLPNETLAYVPKLIAVKNIILSPESYGLSLPDVVNRPYFTQVAAPEKIDVKLAARLAEMPEDEFAQLNPSFNKPVAATGTGYFLVPTHHADVFKTNLDLYRSLNAPMISWTTVTAARGLAVDAVARRHGMTASYLRATNGPFKERKGKLTQPITFMAPNLKEAEAIRAAFDKKVTIKRERQLGSASDGEAVAVVPAREPPVLIAAATPPPLPTPPLETTIYTVQPGDTLFAIARRSALPLDEIKALNQLTGNQVNVGQMLTVRRTESVASTALLPAASVTPAKAAATSSMSARFHVVRAGDTLFAIAKRFNTSVTNLQAWNRLAATTVLKTGLKLKVSV